MEESIALSLSTTTILLTLIALSISLYYTTGLLARKRAGHVGKVTAPEAGGSWPFLGHLRLLGGPRPPHFVLAQMADKYGPIFTIRLGIRRAIVVNTWEVAKECLTTHDRAFATRPRSVASDVMTFNYGIIGFAPYTPYWRQARKISTLELLSNHRIELLRQVRVCEVRDSMRDVYDKHRKNILGLVDMKRWFGDVSINLLFKMIVGRRFQNGDEGDEKVRQGLRDFFDLMGTFVVSDGLPFLRWLDIGGHEKAMKKTFKDLNGVVQGWLEEHKLRRKLRKEAGEKNIEQDFFFFLIERGRYLRDFH